MTRRSLGYGAGAVGALVIVMLALYVALRPTRPTGILEANGQVRGTEVTLSAKVGGVADVVAIGEGQLIHAGGLIAQIASREVEARLDQVRAQAVAAENLIAEIDAAIAVLVTTAEQATLGATIVAGTSPDPGPGPARRRQPARCGSRGRRVGDPPGFCP